jgi:hypothetical protein
MDIGAKDVFISYSRLDVAFAQKLDESLKATGRDPWIDWDDIPLTADWWEEIQRGIEAANTFVFIISPDSVTSEVCNREVDHAAGHNKRIVPVVYRDADDVPPTLAHLNWLFFRETDDFDAAFQALIDTIDSDLDWIRAHTRLTTRAVEWGGKERNESFLLRGDDLADAEQILAQTGKEPALTELQIEYILASRQKQAADRKWAKLQKYGRNILLVSLVVYGWYNVYNLAAHLEKNTIETHQDSQLEIVRNTARVANLYISQEMERRGQAALDEIEHEVQIKFVEPIGVSTDEQDARMLGEGWLYAPDHIVFDESGGLPEKYRGMSISEIFQAQKEDGARHYQEMVKAVGDGQEGVGWYVFWPDKGREYAPWWEFITQDSGREIAAWTPIEVSGNKWGVGMSAVLTRLMEHSGAYRQTQNAIIQMIIVTVMVAVLLYLLNTAERQAEDLRQKVKLLQLQMDRHNEKIER